jgi:prepilin-type N-terminal cleavage/methylation domain-containing protein
MHRSSRKAFTLIELLVVIAIIAVLAVVVVLVLNPAQLLKQARDSSRLSDAATLKSALSIYSEDVGGSMGSSSIVYVSIPDPSATTTAGDQCQGLNLPALTGSSTYQCASSSTYRNVNGLSWIPINFTSSSVGSPIGSLPIDPINTTSSGYFYTYNTNGTQWETTMALESSKYALTEASDGGPYADLYEQGTKLTLAPIDFYASSTAGPGNPVVYYNGSISASGTTTSTITFSGTAGEVINYALTSIPNGFCNTIRMGILNPDGSTLRNSSLCTNNAAFDNVVLSITGTYTAYLTPESNSPSGIATITQNLTGSLAFNTITAISSAYPGQGFNETFSGTAGEVINDAATNLSNGYCNTLSFGILNPDGSTLTNNTLCTNNTSINNLTLPTTGTYTAYLLQTSGVQGTLSGNLTLTQNLVGPLAFNSPTATSTSLPGQGFNYTFSGTSGEVISETLTSLPNGFCNTLKFGILNPDGSTLTNSTLCANSASISSTTLSTTGTYTTYLTPVNAGQTALSGTFTITHN